MHAYDIYFFCWTARRSFMAPLGLPVLCWANAFQNMKAGSDVLRKDS